ncbi:hypothetical protein PUN28_009598 [Cardiocondyla obscurior]|uniref:Secreted protein n=1 Tax=Cardiocondyla obscurior TaxID=286306 RepID=A0AAW2FUL7_9HYME
MRLLLMALVKMIRVIYSGFYSRNMQSSSAVVWIYPPPPPSPPPVQVVSRGPSGKFIRIIILRGTNAIEQNGTGSASMHVNDSTPCVPCVPRRLYNRVDTNGL